MATEARAPVIEIIERGRATDGDTAAGGVVIPNDVRINGQSILCANVPVTVHEIETTARGVVQVTLTVLARRVIIGAELDD